MKTPEEIADSIAQNIAGIYLRPSMHVGAIDSTHTANSLGTILFALHYQWAFAHDREKEFRPIVNAQRKAAHCDSFGFADAFRRFNEGVTDEQAARFVMRNWREISIKLEIPLTDGSGRNAMDAEL